MGATTVLFTPLRLEAVFEFVLDIDYILQWDKPKDDEYFSFRAPAKLVLWNVSELEIHLEPFDDGRMRVLSSQPGH